MALKEIKGEAKEIITYVVIIFVVVIVATVLWKLYKGAKTGANAAGQALGDVAISNQTGIPKARVSFCRDVANKLNSLVSRRGAFIPKVLEDIDEDGWIAQLNQLVSVEEVKLVSDFYQQASGYSLKSDVNSSFDTGEKRRLKSFIYSNLT